MKVYFARHGQTNYNDLELCNSDPNVDVHLTEEGEEQAATLTRQLSDIEFDRIFASELKRTQQTAMIVNSLHEVQIEISPLLNDHQSGFEGQPVALLMSSLDAAEDRWNARFNHGESIEDMKKRVATFLEELKTKPYETVLIVTSQWVIQAAAALINNISNEEAWQLNVQQGGFMKFDLDEPEPAST